MRQQRMWLIGPSRGVHASVGGPGSGCAGAAHDSVDGVWPFGVVQALILPLDSGCDSDRDSKGDPELRLAEADHCVGGRCAQSQFGF